MREVLRRRFAEDVRVNDPDGVFVGHAGLEQFSAGFRARFPLGRFTLTGSPQTAGNGFRAFRTFGPAGHPSNARMRPACMGSLRR